MTTTELYAELQQTLADNEALLNRQADEARRAAEQQVHHAAEPARRAASRQDRILSWYKFCCSAWNAFCALLCSCMLLIFVIFPISVMVHILTPLPLITDMN
jgi:hypothetical protein